METTIDESNHYASAMGRRRRVNPLDMLFPVSAIPLLLLLLLVTPLALLTAESLAVPLIESLRSLVSPETALKMRTVLPVHFYVKLGIFLLLVFFSFFQMLQRIRLIYTTVWARSFERPHSLHVDYQPDKQQSMLALLNWNMYRWLLLLVPPVLAVSLTVATLFGELYLFSHFTSLPGLSLPATLIVFLFVLLTLTLISVVTVLNGIWTALTTLFGDVAAMTEPDASARTVYERSRRVAFSSPLVLLLYPTYLVFIMVLVAFVVWLLMNYDIQDLLHFRLDWLLVFQLEALSLALYIGLSYLQFIAYHHALKRYYTRLPKVFRARFSEPLASYSS